MLKLEGQPKSFLIQSIRRGQAFLVLGAGASKTSLDRNSKELPLGRELAQFLAEECGFTYSGDSLKDVLAACIPRIISEQKLHEILADRFLDTAPSEELKELLKFSWARLYTWNIDDTIENIKWSAQRRSYYNGMIDKVRDKDGSDKIGIIYLHGEARKPEHGFIFSEQEYNSAIIGDRHEWYKQLGRDYASIVPIFIGSELDEQILSLELDRARPTFGAGLGMAYLITPSDLSEIKKQSLAARNIVYVQGYLKDFTDFLSSEIGKAFGPAEVASEISAFASSVVNAQISDGASLEAAKRIFRVSASDVKIEIEQFSKDAQEKASRAFLEGAPPGWRIAMSDTPAWLSQTDNLYEFIGNCVQDRVRLGVIVGQAGSGKSTALMQALLRYSQAHDDLPIYDITGDVPSLRAALGVLGRAVNDEHIIVHISDMFVFGDSFAEDILLQTAGRITVFSSARTGEWRSHLKRHVQEFAKEFTFEQISPSDYDPLIERLLRYVPSPILQKMTPQARRARLSQSRSQLLIALKETTYAEAFTDVITKEYEELPTKDEKMLLLIAGLASISRAGISLSMAKEAYLLTNPEKEFDETMEILGGIAVFSNNGRLSARHELYVRHIFENVADLNDIIDAIIVILKTFTIYDHPVTRNVSRLDGLLFRFLLNHSFVKDLAWRRAARMEGLRIYQDFEVDFQLDGHFWLQYGQYLSEVGELPEAMKMLKRSIQAYPENEYAMHALADLQLKVASQRTEYDSKARELIGNAVEILTEQDSRMGGPSDHYAIVTLAQGHVGALIHHGQESAATEAAKRYLARIQQMRKNDHSDMLELANEKLLRLLTSGDWSESPPQRAGRGKR